MMTDAMRRPPGVQRMDRRGFTVLEMIVTMSCIATLAGLATYAYLAYSDRAYRQLCYVQQSELQKQIDTLEGANLDGPMPELYESLKKANSQLDSLRDPGHEKGSWTHYFILPGTHKVSCTVHDTYDPASR